MGAGTWGYSDLLDLAGSSDSGSLDDVCPLRLVIHAQHGYGITLAFQEAKLRIL